jgi:hypothetical protein
MRIPLGLLNYKYTPLDSFYFLFLIAGPHATDQHILLAAPLSLSRADIATHFPNQVMISTFSTGSRTGLYHAEPTENPACNPQ